MYLSSVLEEEVIQVVRKLASKHSSGYDGISVFLIKKVVSNISKPLCAIINKSFQVGLFPKNCKIAKIIPVFKSGDRSNFINYRPISLLPSFSKIIEKLMLNRLLSFFNYNNILNNCQHGFRLNHSTSTAIAQLLNTVTYALDKGEYVLSLFLDLAKAFDSLDHSILIKKLELYGIRGCVLDWFKSYLTDRFQYIVHNNNRSSLRLIKSGIPQGSILGPILFNLFVNDLPSIDQEVKSVLYADDTVLSISDINPKVLYAKASCLFSKFSVWFKVNKLALNVLKTYFVVFTSPRCYYVFPDTLNVDGYNIKRVNFVRYLGILIDSKLTWHKHLLYVNDKINKGLSIC
jgi:hypothetical protein